MDYDALPDIKRLHSRNLSTREIGMELGLDTKVVSRIMMLNGLKSATGNHLKLSPTEVIRIKELAARGMTPQEMGDAMRLTPETVRRYLDELGVEFTLQRDKKKSQHDQLLNSISKLLDEGLNHREVRTKLGLNEAKYNSLRNELGMGAGSVKELDENAVRELHGQGLSESEIASRLGVTRRRVRSSLLYGGSVASKEPKHGIVGGILMNRGCECSLCRKARAVIRQEMKAKNDATAAEAENSWKEWTGPELEIIARYDLTAKQKAAMLKRTLYSVQAAVHRVHHDPAWIEGFGIKVPEKPAKYRATPQDIDLMLDRSRTPSEIAQQLGCSVSLVHAYRSGKAKGGRQKNSMSEAKSMGS